MAVTFLHGLETIEDVSGGLTANTAKSSVIGLIGIAPEGLANKLLLCNNATDDAQFGGKLPGFGIPKALDIIRQSVGATPVLVINIFDPATHTTQVTGEVVEIANGGFKLANAPIGVVTFKDDGGDPVDYVINQDYTLDAYGNFKVIGGAIPDGTTLEADYKKLNSAAITAAAAIGVVNADGSRTGLKLFETANNQFGYSPKILLAPYLIENVDIAAAVAATATKIRAIYLVDAPKTATVSSAIAGRGTVTPLAGFNSNDGRAFLLFPYVLAYDEYSDSDQPFPLSMFVAPLIVATDNNYGYWFSPSNQPKEGSIPVMTGLSTPISWGYGDTGSDANLLNAQGISTVANGYGLGFKLWGNRSALFPSAGGPLTFLSMQRLDDMVSESIEMAFLPFLDQPITQALIDAVRAKGNAFIATLIQRGALQPGSKIVYNTSDNPADQLANGQIVFERDYMGATPAERITVKNVIDISLLASIK